MYQVVEKNVYRRQRFVNLLQDAFAFFSVNALHEYSRRCAPPVELVSD
jgi:hypothetical protein